MSKSSTPSTFAKVGLAVSLTAFVAGIVSGCAESNQRETIRSTSRRGGNMERFRARDRDPSDRAQVVSAQDIQRILQRAQTGQDLFPAQLGDGEFKLFKILAIYENRESQASVEYQTALPGSISNRDSMRLNVTSAFPRTAGSEERIDFSVAIPHILKKSDTDNNIWNDMGGFSISNDGQNGSFAPHNPDESQVNLFAVDSCLLADEAQKECTVRSRSDIDVKVNIKLRRASTHNVTLELVFTGQPNERVKRTFIVTYQRQ